ncbi:MAG: HlyC/CorC family transporter [Oscillospiraceae bacterium]|nr:HlyC/CorC family transporter [Oscillospiraceae bacterium]
MDPDGTIYFLISFILNVLLCLYIAAVRRSEDYDDHKIGVSRSLISALLLCMVNTGLFVGLVMPLFDLQWKCIFGALFVFLGTFMPYCIGIAQYEKLDFVKKLINPAVILLNYTVTFIITLPIIAVFRIFKFNTKEEATQEDVMELVEDVSEDIIDEEQKEMIENIFEFGEITVSEIMTHRTEVFAVDGEESCRDVIAKMKEEGFSRIPVYNETIDTITGILYVKDLLGAIGDEEKLSQPVKNLARKAMFVPKSCLADDLLVQFKLKRMQLAVVVDEYGGTSGIIIMEDILEEIVGNIQDEYDNEEEEFHKIDENTIECVASLDIEDAFEALGMEEVAEDMENDGYDTVGGLIINKLARIPEQGEDACVEHMGVKFSVLEVADRRIVKVKAEKIIEQTEE